MAATSGPSGPDLLCSANRRSPAPSCGSFPGIERFSAAWSRAGLPVGGVGGPLARHGFRGARAGGVWLLAIRWSRLGSLAGCSGRISAGPLKRLSQGARWSSSIGTRSSCCRRRWPAAERRRVRRTSEQPASVGRHVRTGPGAVGVIPSRRSRRAKSIASPFLTEPRTRPALVMAGAVRLGPSSTTAGRLIRAADAAHRTTTCTSLLDAVLKHPTTRRT